jgi:phage terminase small subunit
VQHRLRGSRLWSWEESEKGEAKESKPEEAVEEEASWPPENATNFWRNVAKFLATATDLPNHRPTSFIYEVEEPRHGIRF